MTDERRHSRRDQVLQDGQRVAGARQAGMQVPAVSDESSPSYHDLHITTAQIQRMSIFNLPYGLEVACTRVACFGNCTT